MNLGASGPAASPAGRYACALAMNFDFGSGKIHEEKNMAFFSLDTD